MMTVAGKTTLMTATKDVSVRLMMPRELYR